MGFNQFLGGRNNSGVAANPGHRVRCAAACRPQMPKALRLELIEGELGPEQLNHLCRFQAIPGQEHHVYRPVPGRCNHR